MIELKISEVAQSKGITTAYQLQKAMNIPPGMAARLWRGNMKMIGIETIDSLCEALDCEPADLIVRVKEKKTNGRSKK
ncbi:MAG: helix-turn-helix transcriptional regulator [Acidobacteria bacterium]|nr:helix-turn-helix transcriptional regulator [Acidobacteriota bacterium]